MDWHGDVAQLEEHRLCMPGVVGSSPIVSTPDRGMDGRMSPVVPVDIRIGVT